jgi:glycosyltransferase involved in cell wall biosynthesis
MKSETNLPEAGNKNSISFIIPVLNGSGHIGDCLDHIVAEMEPGDEIIVVDNGSTDGTLEIVRKYDKVMILQHPDITIAGLRNRGAAIAGGTLFAFIDSDCLVCRGWRKAVEDAVSDGSIHATGSISAVPSGARWVERTWLSQRFKSRTRVSYMGSANFVVRADVFRDVDGFNESLVTDEDTDIGMRITGRGYNIVEDPAVRIIHLGNSKTILQYYKRQKWHATSLIETAFKGGIDKPFIMTIIFMMSCSMSVIYLFISGIDIISLILLAVSLVAVPAFTAFYKIITFKNAGYFFYLIILYFIFYLARSITITQYLFKRIGLRKS